MYSRNKRDRCNLWLEETRSVGATQEIVNVNSNTKTKS